uniref:Ribonuclease H-like domain-containing protein n=1 Tax=Tanacetum cinerariifolium TaxID=118510 RepID=A0A6L2NVM6_TANCI|nr:ribonuclease H-like domain-containing protein [Tanacetum cinerariifolium]
MVMRFRVGTNCPTERPSLHMSSVYPLLKSYHDAFNDPNWQNGMCDEYNALIKNKTWTLVPRPPDTNIVCCMWLFRHKYLADGSLSRYKARLVTNGSTQLKRIDDDEIFSLVVKPGTIQTVFSLTTSRHWPVHQLDFDEILERAHMVTCNHSQTPIDTESKLEADGDSVSNPTVYPSLAGSLQYLTFTRPDISYAVHQVCLCMHDPREHYFSAFKRILRYVQGTLDYGLQLFSSSTTDLVAYSDADWAGCLTTRRSTLGYCVFLGNNLLFWSSKRQPTLSRSSAEAKYRGVANAVLLTPVGCAIYYFADIFTKGLPSTLFEEFRSSLSVRRSPAPTAREC